MGANSVNRRILVETHRLVKSLCGTEREILCVVLRDEANGSFVVLQHPEVHRQQNVVDGVDQYSVIGMSVTISS